MHVYICMHGHAASFTYISCNLPVLWPGGLRVHIVGSLLQILCLCLSLAARVWLKVQKPVSPWQALRRCYCCWICMRKLVGQISVIYILSISLQTAASQGLQQLVLCVVLPLHFPRRVPTRYSSRPSLASCINVSSRFVETLPQQSCGAQKTNPKP